MELGERVLVADGGLATELEARGNDLSDALWSARLLLDAPEEIVAVHRAFFAAGADIATTASYQASYDGFAARGLSRTETTALLQRSVELARKACEGQESHVHVTRRHERGFPDIGRSGGQRWVAASVGPYGAALADGSEYRGRYGLSVAELRRWHRPRLEVLAEAGPDVLALETVPDVDEAEALVDAISGLGVPAWLSFTIDGEHTRAGQPLAEAFAVAAAPEIVAVGVNCCAPADVAAAAVLASEVTGKPVIAYPNSGEGWDADRRTWTGEGRFSPADARQWVAAGARIVGGCCRVNPEHIAQLALLRGESAPPTSGTGEAATASSR